MNLLAIDTSSDACSVAVATDDGIVEQHVVEPRAHTNILLPMIREVVAESKVQLGDLDAILLGNGPGSFIGMRIGASVVQGLAFGLGIVVVPVSSLAAVAAEALSATDADSVIVAQDARMGDVYLGAYSRGPEQRPVELQPTVLHKVADAVRLPASGPAVLAGAGWFRHSELKTAGDWTPKRLEAVLFPRARFLLGIGASRFREKRSVSPPTWFRITCATRLRPCHHRRFREGRN